MGPSNMIDAFFTVDRIHNKAFHSNLIQNIFIISIVWSSLLPFYLIILKNNKSEIFQFERARKNQKYWQNLDQDF